MNILCTICSDLLNQAESIYVTKCGHIFHLNCLSQWIARSKSCPQCRNKVTDRCMFRIYPTISSDNTGDSDTAETIQTKLDDAQLVIRQHKAELKAAKEKLKQSEDAMKEFEKTVKRVEEKLVSKLSAIVALTEQINYLKVENKLVNKLKEENDSMKKKINTMEGLQRVLNSVAEDVESILKGYPDVKTIALFATALKRALLESESKKNEYRDRLYAAKQHIATEENKNADMFAQIAQLKHKLAYTERRLQESENKSLAIEQLSSKKKTSSSLSEDIHFFGSPKKRTSSDNEQSSSRPKRQRKNSKEEVPSTPGTSRTAGKGSPGKTKSSKKADASENSEEDESEVHSCRSDPDDVRVTLPDGSNRNLNMLKRLEDTSSPYLALKQGQVPLRTIHMYPSRIKAEKDRVMLSSIKLVAEFTLLPTSRTKENHSIFNSNRDKNLIIQPNKTDGQTDISYDGLGGHSKLDVFPKSRPVLKNCIPKLTAKHKLKRPVASGSQDITKMFEKIVDK